MYHRKCRHITGNIDDGQDMELESGESDLELCGYCKNLLVGERIRHQFLEPLASVVTHKNKQESDIEHKRNGEGELSGAAAVGGLLYEDTKHFYGGTKHRNG